MKKREEEKFTTVSIPTPPFQKVAERITTVDGVRLHASGIDISLEKACWKGGLEISR